MFNQVLTSKKKLEANRQVQAPPHKAGVGQEEEAGLALGQDHLAGFENAEQFQNQSFSKMSSAPVLQ